VVQTKYVDALKSVEIFVLGACEFVLTTSKSLAKEETSRAKVFDGGDLDEDGGSGCDSRT